LQQAFDLAGLARYGAIRRDYAGFGQQDAPAAQTMSRLTTNTSLPMVSQPLSEAARAAVAGLRWMALNGAYPGLGAQPAKSTCGC
jgi:hypothetical protein